MIGMSWCVLVSDIDPFGALFLLGTYLATRACVRAPTRSGDVLGKSRLRALDGPRTRPA